MGKPINMIILSCSILFLSGCSTPEEQAQARERERIEKLREIELREIGYRQACIGYGYKPSTPSFNQCVATERRQYAAEVEADRAREERARLKAALEKSYRDEEDSKSMQCLMDGGVMVWGVCM